MVQELKTRTRGHVLNDAASSVMTVYAGFAAVAVCVALMGHTFGLIELSLSDVFAPVLIGFATLMVALIFAPVANAVLTILFWMALIASVAVIGLVCAVPVVLFLIASRLIKPLRPLMDRIWTAIERGLEWLSNRIGNDLTGNAKATT